MASHAEQMDAIYRWQRPIYDLTRKYYLFGRDGLIDRLPLAEGGSVLEIGCGTGRNLALIRRRWPNACLFGLDISVEMLRAAHSKLGDRARLAAGDACGFDPDSLFGQTAFDCVLFSYTLSMIPDWRGAMSHALETLGEGGSLYAVDFGACEGLPDWARSGLWRWLRHFHVTPRLDLADYARELAREKGFVCTVTSGALGYFRHIHLERPRFGKLYPS